MTREPVTVAIVRNEAEAELACGMLRSEGIDCDHRITDFAFGSGGEMPASGGGPRAVIVRAGDAGPARELLAAGPVDDADLEG